jgi:Acyl-CoA dehydrogenase, C-terminal domain
VKCSSSDVAMQVTTNAVQLFGGYGYTVDFPGRAVQRNAKITQIRRRLWSRGSARPTGVPRWPCAAVSGWTARGGHASIGRFRPVRAEMLTAVVPGEVRCGDHAARGAQGWAGCVGGE